MKQERATKKQQELLQFVSDFIREHDYGPSYREIMRALDYKSVSTVAVHIDGLITKGYLRRRDKSPRSLEIVGRETPESSAPLPKNELFETALSWAKTLPVEKRADVETLIRALELLGQTTEAAKVTKVLHERTDTAVA